MASYACCIPPRETLNQAIYTDRWMDDGRNYFSLVVEAAAAAAAAKGNEAMRSCFVPQKPILFLFKSRQQLERKCAKSL
jgi:hypothetical protein